MDYFPRPTPIEAKTLPAYLKVELNNIAQAIRSFVSPIWAKQTAEPVKPQEGMIVFADGTNWNPGSGKGIYYYNGTTWVKLG